MVQSAWSPTAHLTPTVNSFCSVIAQAFKAIGQVQVQILFRPQDLYLLFLGVLIIASLRSTMFTATHDIAVLWFFLGLFWNLFFTSHFLSAGIMHSPHPTPVSCGSPSKGPGTTLALIKSLLRPSRTQNCPLRSQDTYIQFDRKLEVLRSKTFILGAGEMSRLCLHISDRPSKNHARSKGKLFNWRHICWGGRT